MRPYCYKSSQKYVFPNQYPSYLLLGSNSPGQGIDFSYSFLPSSLSSHAVQGHAQANSNDQYIITDNFQKVQYTLNFCCRSSWAAEELNIVSISSSETFAVSGTINVDQRKAVKQAQAKIMNVALDENEGNGYITHNMERVMNIHRGNFHHWRCDKTYENF